MTLAELKVGELAQQTGISVRTLHHYDEIGLLSPARRSEAGYRLYGPDDVVRLQHILALRHLGFGLDEIRTCLTHPDYTLVRVIELHIERMQQHIEVQRTLCRRLEALADHFKQTEAVSVADVTQILEVIKAMEHYFTPDMMQELEERRKQVGEERIKQVEAEWPILIAEVRTAIANGVAPDSPTAQQLAQRWMGLVEEFTGGNPQIAQAVSTMYQQEPAVAQQQGLDESLFRFIEQANAARRSE
jgi:DNA-binding transcriptional MerR regulator